MLRLTREQVREIDRRSIEEFHIPGIVLMENAARGVVDVALEMLQRADNTAPKVAIVCGGGNNGGDGLAVARHLHNRGVDVWIALMSDPGRLRGDAAINWQIIQAMRCFFCPPADDPKLPFFIQKSDLVIDGLFGTGLQSSPRQPETIDMINELARTILAIDLPSGMDCDTGEPLGTCIKANRTVTFVAEKAGFANPASRQYTGQVIVADIGCPRELLIGHATDNPSAPSP